MNEKDVLNAISKIKETSQKRKFTQTYDFIVTLKGLDLKKTEQQVDFFTNLHFLIGKRSVCGFVGPELYEQAKNALDEAIVVEDFPKYQADKKLAKKLADKHDFFIAQATIMPKVAQTFGRVFGPKGKMPNPKAGCVVPPNANLTQVAERLQMLVAIKAKAHLMIQTTVGKEGMEDKQVAENVLALYSQIIHHLPQEKNNIKSTLLKLTMGKPVHIGASDETEAQPDAKKKAPKKAPKKEEKAPKDEKKAEKAGAEE